MNYYEYIGPPGSGKSTKMALEYAKHKNIINPKGLFNIFKVSNYLFLIIKIYKLNSVKRLIHSIKHFYFIININSDLILDQGLVQIYLSHCSERGKIPNKRVLKEFLELLHYKFKNVNFIFIGEDISLCEINSRLKQRNKNRKNGVNAFFFENFKINTKAFKELLSLKNAY